MKNELDEKGRRRGLWEWYHSNGNLFYIENYKSGALHGLWKQYYYNGELRYKGAYKRGNPVGLWYFSNKA